jgi:HAD superfamily hydrolase (TIGR01509 family)
MSLTVVGFDFIGTLVEADAEWENCILSVCDHLKESGYEFSSKDFISTYRSVTLGYRKDRQEKLVEINNCIWVADTLNRLELEAEPADPTVISAVEKYFQSWEVTPISGASKVLEKVHERFVVSLVSNFTSDFFVNFTLKRLGLDRFFHHVITSDSFGWRKPHPKIFERFLFMSKARAEEAIFIGDDLISDVQGAKTMGIQTVLLDRESAYKKNQQSQLIKPDYIVSSLKELLDILFVN